MGEWRMVERFIVRFCFGYLFDEHFCAFISRKLMIGRMHCKDLRFHQYLLTGTEPVVVDLRSPVACVTEWHCNGQRLRCVCVRVCVPRYGGLCVEFEYACA